MNKILNLIKFFYRNFFPSFIRKRLYKWELRFIHWYNPLSKNLISDLANDDCFEACKKEILNKNNNIRSNYYLHKSFNKYLIRSNLIEDKWWSDFILLTTLPDGIKFQQINKSLINNIDNSNFNSLHYYEVLNIYSLSIRFGLFELGYYLRNKSLKIALSYSTFSKKNEIWKLKAKLSALIETENFSEFDRLLSIFNNRWKKEKNLLSFLRKVYDPSKNLSLQTLCSKMESKQDHKFRKLLENKKLVIVGSSPTNKKNGNAIDSAELVIRNNYINQDSFGHKDFKGSKCEISYINTEKSINIAETTNLRLSSSLLWIVTKSCSDKKIIFNKLSSDQLDTKNLNVRSLRYINSVLFNGALHALPNIIIDLSCFNPKEIFLYHYDLMLTKERETQYYPEYWKEETKKKNYLKDVRLNGLAKHDPVTQFKILKSFWKRGFIKGDTRFEEVISMELKDYMKSLQKYYRGSNDTKIV
ncbi:hypothetical protein OAP88_00875 [Candidatus Pelagibacter sp.]|nr:hypothetical protein [Candidatus Pelagibacter sp.]